MFRLINFFALQNYSSEARSVALLMTSTESFSVTTLLHLKGRSHKTRPGAGINFGSVRGVVTVDKCLCSSVQRCGNQAILEVRETFITLYRVQEESTQQAGN